MSIESSAISIVVTSATRAVTQAGFGVPMIIAYPTWSERIRWYTSLAGVALDFATTTSAYQYAAGIFAQSPAPSRVAIGRGALPPTQVHVIGITTVEHSAAYKVVIDGVTYTYTADSATTNDEIATGLAAAIDAHATLSAAATGSASSLVVTVTAAAAGQWNSIHVLDKAGDVSTNYLSIAQTYVDPGIATDLTALLAASSDWYTLIQPWASSAIITAQNTWIDSNKRTAITATQDSACANVVDASATDIMKTAETAAIARSMLIYHPRPHQAAGAAWAGKVLPLQPGSETWAFKELAGVDKVALTETQYTNIIAKHGNLYMDFAGVGSTFEGWTSGGTYFDLVRGEDWLTARLREGLAQLLISVPKVPYTDAGAAMLQDVIERVLKTAERVGLIRSGWSTDVEPVADQSSANRAARIYPAATFAAVYAGAIHHAVPVTGTLTV